MLTIAIRALRKAGNLIAKSYETPNTLETSQEETLEFVTNVRQSAEQMIIEVIQKTYPQHSIITEELGELIGKERGTQWIINPLDGALNFIKRFPHFSASIAIRVKNRIEIATVYDPIRNDLFTASRGYGAQLNGYRMRGTNAKDLNHAILATGFLPTNKQQSANYIKVIRTLLTQCSDFRRTGSIALDLAYVAAGRLDGFCEVGVKPWNFAAGELLVRESGGLVTDFIGGNNHFNSGNGVAGNPRIVKAMLSVLRTELIDALKD